MMMSPKNGLLDSAGDSISYKMVGHAWNPFCEGEWHMCVGAELQTLSCERISAHLSIPRGGFMLN